MILLENVWQSIYEEFERHFEEGDRQQLISMYVHDDELEKAFDELKDSENLSWLRQYRDPVAAVDPVEYFEVLGLSFEEEMS